MISNKFNNSGVYGSTSIPVQPLIDNIVKFIDKYLPSFQKAINQITPKLETEKLLNQQLVDFFNGKSDEFNPYLPYKFIFRKDDERADTLSKPDVGVTLWNKKLSTSDVQSFFQIECKRLPTPNSSTSRSEKEYVMGTKTHGGGIERFKNSKHGSHLNEAALIGYVQSESLTHWNKKIKSWIKEEIDTKTKTYTWDKQDYLKKSYAKPKLHKYHSTCTRDKKPPVKLHHYLMDIS